MKPAQRRSGRPHQRRPASSTRSHARFLPHNCANEACTARKRRLHEDQAMRSACGGNAGRSCATSPARHTTPVLGGLAWCLGQHRQQARTLRSSGRKRLANHQPCRSRWWMSIAAPENTVPRLHENSMPKTCSLSGFGRWKKNCTTSPEESMALFTADP